MAERTKYMILNGELAPERALDGTFLYQHIHTLDYQPRHTAAHVGVLNRKSQLLFGKPFTTSVQGIEMRIGKLLEHSRISRRVSTRVTIKLYASGDYTIEYDQPSIYSGYAMRSLRPDAAIVEMSIPMEDYPTDAALAARSLADTLARTRGFHSAIMTTPDNRIVSEATQPLAIVNGVTLILSESDSVESNLMERAARKAGFGIKKRALMRDDLQRAEEVITMNWQGITAIYHIGNKAYMSIIAERIAQQLEAL